MMLNLDTLTDRLLMTSAEKVISSLRSVDLSLLEHLGAIETRELHLRAGYPSMFKLCTDKFRLSEASAYRRVAAARLLHKYPSVKAQLLDGEVNMCTLATVAARLGELPSEEERLSMLRAIRGKSKSQVEELLARQALNSHGGRPAKRRDVIRPVRAAQRKLPIGAVRPSEKEGFPEAALSPMSDASTILSHSTVGQESVSFRIAFTASSAFRAKLERAKDLLKHKHPDGSLEAILEEALNHLIKARDISQKHMKNGTRGSTERAGKASNKQSTKPSASARYIPVAIRRHVAQRDGGQCTFTGWDGRRCQERAGLEYEHRTPFARGGSSFDPGNIELLCRSHNALRARLEFSISRRLSGPARV